MADWSGTAQYVSWHNGVNGSSSAGDVAISLGESVGEDAVSSDSEYGLTKTSCSISLVLKPRLSGLPFSVGIVSSSGPASATRWSKYDLGTACKGLSEEAVIFCFPEIVLSVSETGQQLGHLSTCF